MPHLRRSPALQPWFAFLLALVASLIPHGAWAQAADPYAVRNIQVDISADNVNVAREKALLDGQRQAYAQLLQRLTSAADAQRLPKISDAELQNLVLDVGIDQEKRSNIRYLATLSVRFKPDAVRRLLRSANIAYAEWRGRPVAVLPVWRDDTGAVVLFEAAPNPWRDAWKSGAAQGIVPLVVPQAPAGDDPLLAGATVAGGGEALTAVAQRYNTPDVIDAVATLQRLDGNRLKVDVVLSGLGPVGGLATGTRSYTGEVGEALDSVLRHAVEDIAKTINDAWKGGNTLQYDRSASLAVLAPLADGLNDWVALRDKLTRSTPVRSFEVAAMSRAEASLVLHYVGDQQQLAAVLMQNGLVLTWAEDHWVLQNAVKPAFSLH